MDNRLVQFYRGKSVLITGHTGFKGAWLSLWLKQLGANVVGFSLGVPTSPSLFEVTSLENDIIHIKGDVRDLNSLTGVIADYKPEIIFHLAAQSLVRQSYSDPVETYSTNVVGSLNVFEAVRKNNSVKTIINVTSDKCYENKEWNWGYRENDRLGGHDPYSSSKGCSEILTASYRSSFFPPEKIHEHGVSLVSARAGNVIGGGDWAKDRLIPDCARYLSENKSITIRNPQAIRPWEFVLEPLSGYLWLAMQSVLHPGKYAQAWNFGPFDDAILSVEKVVEKFIKVWGKGDVILDTSPKPHEANLLKLDISKAIYDLGWKPGYCNEDAIVQTVEWYKSYYDSSIDMKKYSIDQINRYSKVACEKGIAWAN